MSTLTVWRVTKPHGRWVRVSRRSIVSGIYPEPSGLGLASARGQHFNGCVISMQLLGSKDVFTKFVHQGVEQVVHPTGYFTLS